MLEILRSKKDNADQPMLKKLFIEELNDIYSAEQQLVKALPEMGQAASSSDLAAAFADHLKVTENQVARLEKVFRALGEEPQSKKCKGMQALIEEGRHMIKETEEGTATRDVALIVSAQKVEHYEIAAYGSLKQLALTVGKTDVLTLLEETLAEEKETDMVLSNLAEMFINREAVEE